MTASPRPLDLVPHRRYNPLLREWVLVSPQRTERPWLGETSKQAAGTGLAYDPACYLCPGNARSGGARNPAYTGVFAFDNDFPALLTDAAAECATQAGGSPLLVAEPERGRCRVICFHPNHSLTLARMEVGAIAAVVDAWAGETATLGGLAYINHVQIFENRGAMMGASNPHPHCQIWATEHVPDETLRELAAQREYMEEHRRCLLCEYLATETAAARSGEAQRIVAENETFVAVVPYWATWPFETLLLPRRHLGSMTDLTPEERSGLAGILKAVTTRYDNLFQVSFPYSLGFHQRPTDGGEHGSMHFHGHFYPPLLRSAEVRKFMVGFEMFGGPQRDLTPESAAKRLRAVAETHYLE